MPIYCPLPSTYLHRDLIVISSWLHRDFTVWSPLLRRNFTEYSPWYKAHFPAIKDYAQNTIMRIKNSNKTQIWRLKSNFFQKKYTLRIIEQTSTESNLKNIWKNNKKLFVHFKDFQYLCTVIGLKTCKKHIKHRLKTCKKHIKYRLKTCKKLYYETKNLLTTDWLERE